MGGDDDGIFKARMTALIQQKDAQPCAAYAAWAVAVSRDIGRGSRRRGCAAFCGLHHFVKALQMHF